MKKPDVIICGGGIWELYDVPCPFCDDVVPGIFREVFDGYSYDMVCGFCGTWIMDGEYRDRMPESERNRNITLVERERMRIKGENK